ncbi:MAG: hypothetical protein ACLGH6_05295 [Gammaproteobacteria bacterium]
MRLLQRLNRLSFRRQIAWAFAAGIVLVYLTSSVVIAVGSVRAVRDAMLEDGRQLAENFAAQSALALLYHSADNVKDAAEVTLGFPDVVSVSVFTAGGEQLAAFGNAVNGAAPDPASFPAHAALYADTPKYLGLPHIRWVNPVA